MLKARQALARVRDQGGLTLTELVVVFVLATMIMSGLVAFYLNTQATWIDGSSKVIAQREGALVLQTISDRIRGAGSAVVSNSPDADHAMLQLNPVSGVQDSTYFFWWSAADSLIHEGYRFPAVVDRGPMLLSKVDRFRVVAADSIVNITSLRLYSAPLWLFSTKSDTIELATSVRLVNW